MVRWHNSESTVRPLTVDDTMSKIVVYLRRNIQEEVRTDDQGNETTWYVYEEAEVEKEQLLKEDVFYHLTLKKALDLLREKAVITEKTITE